MIREGAGLRLKVLPARNPLPILIPTPLPILPLISRFPSAWILA
jgi:hypothetical protein